MSDAWGDPDPNRTWQPGTQPGGDWSYYAGEPGTAWTPPTREPVWPRLLADLVTFGQTVAALVLCGAPFGLLWRALAPTAEILHTASGPQPAAPESNQVFATDGWFALLSIVAGVVLGAVAWWLLRRRGPAVPVGLAAGGVLAGLVAAAVGRRIVVDQYLYDFCHRGNVKCFVYDGTMRLHALAAVVVLPIVLVASYAVLTLFFDHERPAAVT